MSNLSHTRDWPSRKQAFYLASVLALGASAVLLPPALGEFVFALILSVIASVLMWALSNLKRSSRKTQGILDSITDAFLTFDDQWRFTSVNAEAERLMGKPAEELLGRNVWEEYPSSKNSVWYSEYLRAKLEGVSVQFEVYDEETKRWHSVRTYPSAEGLTVYFHDITRHKVAEMELARKQEELEAANRRLAELASTDPLTGLRNRRCFECSLESEYARSTRYKGDLSLVLIDVDHFKEFNDEFGHLAGDAALKEIGEVIERTLRSGDTAARYGGEEFAVLLPNTCMEGALVFANRLRAAIESAHWPIKPVTASFGVATLTPSLHSAQELFQAADEALYDSKNDGRNRVSSAWRLTMAT
jgi:diguanylate cyclase (GGDEF)-like protein/PAS domain S-box-containing protein